MELIISETDEVLVSHSGMALAGAVLQRSRLRQRLDAMQVDGRKRPTVSHGEVLLSMIGLLCLGKSDYAAIEPFRQEAFFARALGLKRLRSQETLRQRLDQLGTAPLAILLEETADMIGRNAPALKPCHRDRVPLDIDVSPWDNSGTKKEGVACTYKLCDGYAPIFAHLGQEGYLVDCELRPGDQHCQRGTPEFLDRAIARARRATDAKLLVRTASAEEVIELYHQHATSEQFHSELKTEMDLERLPSGKFATNALMLALGQVAYNVLRLCGQAALEEDRALAPEEKMPLSKPVRRRRVRSVMQDLMYLAARLTRHARRWGLSLWRDNPWRFVWQRVYHRFTQSTALATGPSP